MGDPMMKETTAAKPRMGLEELYLGIPDESVNLTFQDLADFSASGKEIRPPITPINEPVPEVHRSPPPLAKIPSLEFSTGLHHHGQVDVSREDMLWGPYGNHGHASGARNPHAKASGDSRSGYSMGYDDMSTASGRGSGRRRRPGIPHSKICTICSTYIYIFRTRCLVCGRVYCRQCVEIGMGEMTEGRKCIECLGLRFSQRYIEKAGKVWCCGWRYPSTLKQVELKWAEKGPRRSGDKGYNSHHSGAVSSRSRSPVTPRTRRHHDHATNYNQPSFVTSSSFSPYSTPLHHHHLPL